jgi:hypothetical protein
VKHWVWLPWATERHGRKSIKAMVGKLKARMLPGNEKSRRLAKVGEGVGNRAQLDGFWTRPDNKRDTILAQLPPWLRRSNCRRRRRAGQEKA